MLVKTTSVKKMSRWHITMTYSHDDISRWHMVLITYVRDDISWYVIMICHQDMSSRTSWNPAMTCNDICNDILRWHILMTSPPMTYLMTYVRNSTPWWASSVHGDHRWGWTSTSLVALVKTIQKFGSAEKVLHRIVALIIALLHVIIDSEMSIGVQQEYIQLIISVSKLLVLYIWSSYLW